MSHFPVAAGSIPRAALLLQQGDCRVSQQLALWQLGLGLGPGPGAWGQSSLCSQCCRLPPDAATVSTSQPGLLVCRVLHLSGLEPSVPRASRNRVRAGFCQAKPSPGQPGTIWSRGRAPARLASLPPQSVLPPRPYPPCPGCPAQAGGCLALSPWSLRFLVGVTDGNHELRVLLAGL